MKRIVLLNNRQITLQEKFDMSPFRGISWAKDRPFNPIELFRKLRGKHPYTITILTESLKGEYRRRKKYVEFTRRAKQSLYRQKLYEEF